MSRATGERFPPGHAASPFSSHRSSTHFRFSSFLPFEIEKRTFVSTVDDDPPPPPQTLRTFKTHVQVTWPFLFFFFYSNRLTMTAVFTRDDNNYSRPMTDVTTAVRHYHRSLEIGSRNDDLFSTTVTPTPSVKTLPNVFALLRWHNYS